MGTWFGALGIAAALTAAPQEVAPPDASGPAPADAAIEGFVADLGDPPLLDRVNALVHDARLADAATARAVAEALTSRGGCAVAQGLLELVRHRDATVRFAALRGIAEVGLRRADGMVRVRAALRDADAMVRSAACEAIGRVGDASDLPLLLDGLVSEDERTRGAAGEAIAKLTGLNLPTGDATRWTDWWKQAKGWIPAQLDRAIERIDAGGEPADLRDARAFLAQYTWFDVEKVQGAVAVWLRTFDSRHRTEGYRAAAACRLADLADDVRRAALDEDEPGVVAVALRSCMRLGVSRDGMKCSPATPALVALLEKANDDASDDPDATLEEMVARITVPKEQADAVAATQASAGGSGHGGGVSGSAVWLDLDAKRARWKSAAAEPDAVAPRGDASAASASVPWTAIGLTLVAATLVAVAARAVVRRRADAQPAPVAVVKSGTHAAEMEPLSSDELATELCSAGLDPESLAAAAVRAREVGRLIDGARKSFAENASLRRDAGASRAADREALRARMFDAATAVLSTDSKATLRRIRENRAGRPLPVPYLVVERSDDEWDRLGELLEREAAAADRKEALEPDLEATLQEVRADLPVRQARRNLSELLDGVTAAWTRAIATDGARDAERPGARSRASRSTASVG